MFKPSIVPGRSAAGCILWGVALAPFWSALFLQAHPRPACATAQAPPRPALAFDQYLVNLREIEPQPYALAHFRFTNRGTRPAVVRELKPSCGCLKPRLDKREYAPGESGAFFLRVQTANEQPGPKEYFLDLRYDDPEPREVRLTFQVVLPQERVAVRPKALVFYQFGDQPTRQELTVADCRSRTLSVTAVESSSPLVAGFISEADVDPDGTRIQRISVEVAGDVPPGRHRALVTIHTDDATYPRLEVPLLIVGREAR